MSVTARELPVLRQLEELTKPYGEYCVPFHWLSGYQKGDPETREVRRIVRQLKRKGLAEYHSGLVNEYTGMLCGSGHCISKKGIDALKEIEARSAQS